jgi:RHS repeat-associated protein
LKGITQRNSSGGIIATSSYVLDDLNRLTATTKNGQTQTYDYDSTDQVKTVTGSNSEAYTYDKNGNRTNSGYITDAGNRLRSDGTYNYEYDFEGNRTLRTKIADGTVDTYSWDYRNRLMGIVTKNLDGVVTRTVGYTYDVDDLRVSKTVDGVVEHYYLDGEQIAFVTDGGGNETFHYLYGLNVDQVLAQDSETGMLWALADRLGSVDTLTDADGTVLDERTFDSFGRLLSETNPSVSFRYGYTGRELDLESGLDYYRARYYDAAVGRFVSVDPMGFGAGDTNLYRYVFNSATNYTDPSGKIVPLLVGLAWAAGVVASAAVTGAAVGGVYGFARGAAGSIDSDRRNGILSWESVGSAYIHGLIGAGNGAVGGAVAGAVVAGGGLIAGAVGVPTAVITGVGATLATVGVGLGVLSAGMNFADGNIATGVVDLASSIYGASKLWSGYQNSKLRFYEEPNPPLLNSSGAIVPAGSSALANRTSVGGSLVPYSNAGGSVVLANAAGGALAQATDVRLAWVHRNLDNNQNVMYISSDLGNLISTGNVRGEIGNRPEDLALIHRYRFARIASERTGLAGYTTIIDYSPNVRDAGITKYIPEEKLRAVVINYANNFSLQAAVSTMVHESVHARSQVKGIPNTKYEEYVAFMREKIHENSVNESVSLRPSFSERIKKWDEIMSNDPKNPYRDLPVGKDPTRNIRKQ